MLSPILDLPLPVSAIATFSLALLPVSLFFIYYLLSPTYKFPANAPPLTKVSGLPIFGALQFFTQRWDFWRHARDAAGGSFTFFVGKHPIVGLSGVEGRKLFFESKELDIHEGNAVLFGQSSTTLDKSKDVESEKARSGVGAWFMKRLTQMLKTENFNKSLPSLMKDVRTNLNELAKDPSGITDPFESIYGIVYKLTIRTLACNDIADDPVLLAKTLSLFETIEASATPATVLFPRLPTPAMAKRTIAGARFYRIVSNIVKKRTAGSRDDDPLQFLIDEGDDMGQIVQFFISAIFAALLNSGVNAAWVMINLAQSPEWMARVRSEITAAGAKYATDKSAPLLEQLSQIPIDGWESSFPAMELCLKDSIRLQLMGTLYRRNISNRSLPIGSDGQVVPPGAYALYHSGDNHRNPEIYTDPEKWDPARYEKGREEDKAAPYGFTGWGAGRHPCMGMRFAKLEQNIITAFFVAMFDFELSDKMGNPTHEAPKMDSNNRGIMRATEKVHLKYKLRA